MIESIILGVHLFSLHIPAGEGMNNNNLGIYLRADGWTAGVYRNTLNRTSIYAGYTIDKGPFSLTVGAVSGYAIERRERPCNDHRATIKNIGTRCYQDEGGSTNKLAPMIAPSIKGPEFIGLTPRLTYIPKLGVNSFNVLHLSVEKSF